VRPIETDARSLVSVTNPKLFCEVLSPSTAATSDKDAAPQQYGELTDRGVPSANPPIGPRRRPPQLGGSLEPCPLGASVTGMGPGRKLLIASVGVATVNYVAVGCETGRTTSANLMAPEPPAEYSGGTGSGGKSSGGAPAGGAAAKAGAPGDSGADSRGGQGEGGA